MQLDNDDRGTALKPKILILYSVSAAVILGILLGRALGVLWAPQNEMTPSEKLFIKISRLVRERYITEVDESELTYRALHAVLESLDNYSRFYEPQQITRLEEETTGKYAGVGFMADNRFEDRLVIQYPFRDSPAFDAGLEPGDEIVEVEGRSIEAMNRSDAIEEIRGDPETPITLTVKKADSDQRKQVTLERAVIRTPAVHGVRMLEDGIGYFWVEAFDPGLMEEFDAAMKHLVDQGMKSLVLDLRYNGGGTVDSAIDLANRFVGKGILATTRGRWEETSNREYRADPAKLRYPDLPLVVLVNELSASATEIVSGALQDHRRAVLVGTRTFGKGVIQSLLSLPERDIALKLTTAAYYTPAGRAIEKLVGLRDGNTRRGGLLPDVVVPVDKQTSDIINYQLTLWRIPERFRDRSISMMRAGTKHPEFFAPVDDPQIDAAIEIVHGKPVVSSLPK